jgi:putative transmembrane protein PGPGW
VTTPGSLQTKEGVWTLQLSVREDAHMNPELQDPDDDPIRKRDVWGDELGERDASATVEEFMAGTEGSRWLDRAPFVPVRVVGGFIARNGKRIAVTIAGFVVVLAGVVMLVVPGPGIVVILLGLAILSTEYVWAERLLRKAREKFDDAKDTVLSRKKKDEPDPG